MHKLIFLISAMSILAILAAGCGSEVSEGPLPTAASGGSETALVPDVVGKSQQEAEQTLRLAGFEVEEQRRESPEGEAGEVVEQSPSGGGEAEEGVAVVIVVVVQAASSASDEEVIFGTVDWPEAIAKTNVSAQMVEALGYKTDVQMLSVPLVFQGLEKGDLDLFTEAWFPTMQTNMDAVDADEVKSVTTNLTEANSSVAVSQAACDAGVRSHEDLDEFSDEFGGTIYGIEPGNDLNQIVIDMIANDTYGLGDWEIVESSTSGMLVEVERRIRDDEWFASVGWEPHWMNDRYDMCLLEDPEKVWGGPWYVETLANAGLQENNPEVYQLFEQMKVDKDIQADWIYQIDSGNEPERLAVEWLRDNPEITDRWMEGVEAADGTPGEEALQRHLEEQASQ